MRCVDTNNVKLILRMVLPVFMTLSTIVAQNNKLIIRSGAGFAGNGEILVKDSIRNEQNTSIPCKVILTGGDQFIASESGKTLQLASLSIRGYGTKILVGSLIISDSLNILSNTKLDISNSTLRILNNSANSGNIITNSNSVIEYAKDNGSEQGIMGGVYHGKIRLSGKSRKSLLGELSVDNTEHEGWGLLVNRNLQVKGKAQIDSLLNVASNVQLSFSSDSSSIKYLQGNDGVIEVQGNGKLTLINHAYIGVGTVRTENATIVFEGNVNSNGVLSVTGNGVMSFAGNVSSASLSFAPGSTVIYNGSNQTMAGGNYGNLRLANTGIKMFASGITGIAGTIIIEDDVSTDAITNSSVVDYNGSGSQVIAGMQYYDLRISNDRSGGQITLPAYDTIKVANTFAVSTTNVVYINENNFFRYNGAITQNVVPFEYYNLILDGGGQKVVSESQNALGNVEQKDRTPLVVNSGVVWNIQGSLITDENFINNGEINIGN